MNWGRLLCALVSGAAIVVLPAMTHGSWVAVAFAAAANGVVWMLGQELCDKTTELCKHVNELLALRGPR